MHNIPRPEYPRPQFVRPDWLNLNGQWEFEIDQGDSGLERGLLHRPLQGRITVPFCPESILSGIGNTDFLNAVWYRRRVVIPPDWQGRKVRLHFQAVDYDATVWVNGAEVRRHRGGHTPFACDLSRVADCEPGREIEIVVRARDLATCPQPRGKQSPQFENFGCLYTRTTGIWQTVWLEPVPESFLHRARITPDVAHARFLVEQPIANAPAGATFVATLRDPAGVVVRSEAAADIGLCSMVDLPIPADRVRLWHPGEPRLYELNLELFGSDGTLIDSVQSYAGLRSITLRGKAVFINDRPVFQRLVLDQGYYPDGILTAPTDEALRRDIELGLAAGFNGARLHEKVFEERFLYHCDHLGYIVWGESPDWGIMGSGPCDAALVPGSAIISEWLEALERDYSHPAIIGWTPLNETRQALGDRITALDDVTRAMFLATKAFDPTRPVVDVSGYSHRVPETDIYDSHDYDQNPATFGQRHDRLAEDDPYVNKDHETGATLSVPYAGQPYFVSEFGGIWWNPDARPGEDSWGYGDRPQNAEEFQQRFAGLCEALLCNPDMFGYCYTQLTDVFQEQNGIYRFDRSSKVDLQRIRAAQTQPAAFEDYYALHKSPVSSAGRPG